MNDTTTFETFVDQERTRLNKQRDKLTKQMSDLEEQIHQVDTELAAIAAYEAAKAGKLPTLTTTKRTTRGARTPGRRDAVLQLITTHPDGLARADILDKMGVKGDKSGEQSVSNALSALKKDNKIGQNGNLYVPA